jgi:hypothetical protein
VDLSGCRYPGRARLVGGLRERMAMINSIAKGTCLIVYFGCFTKSRPDMRGVPLEASVLLLTCPWHLRAVVFLRVEVSRKQLS